MSDDLTHFDHKGRAHMVDVGNKATTTREAVAVSALVMQPATLEACRAGGKKGDVLGVARLAGIMAAKQTAALIPLCHNIPITHVALHFALRQTPPTLFVRATARTNANTGIEMEALTAASIAALTVYDMCKAIDRAMRVGPTFLLHKSGGRSGDFRHPDADTLGPPADAAWV